LALSEFTETVNIAVVGIS